MFTNTSKQILTPLAEAVSQLILIISESDINKTPIPDLTGLAHVVDQQILNLINIGNKIQAQPNADRELKETMPMACQEVGEGSKLLLESTTELLKDTRSSHGKQKLLDAAKGILSGTTAVLKSFDGFEVRKIVRVCQTCKETVLAIKNEGTIQNPQFLIQNIMKASQLIVQVAQTVNKRITDVLSVRLSSRLKMAVGAIVQESPMLINSCKVMLQYPSHLECVEAKITCCDRLIGLCDEMILVLNMSDDQQDDKEEGPSRTNTIDKKTVSQNVKRLESIKNKLYNDVINDVDVNEIQLAFLSYKQQAEQVQSVAEEAITVLANTGNNGKDSDTNTKQHSLIEILEKARSSLAQAESSFTNFAQEPTSRENKNLLFHELHRSSVHCLKLKNAVNNQLSADLIHTCLQLSDSKKPSTILGHYVASSHLGNKEITEQEKQKFTLEFNLMSKLLEKSAQKIAHRDHVLSQSLLVKQYRLSQIKASLMSSCAIRCEFNKDEATKELLESSIKLWGTEMKDLESILVSQQGPFEVEELLDGTEVAISQQIQSLETALVENNQEKVNEVVDVLNLHTANIIEFAKKEINASTDMSYRSKMSEKVAELEKVIPSYINQFLNLSQNDGFYSSEAFQSIVQHLSAHLRDLALIIKKQVGSVESSTILSPPKIPGDVVLEDEKIVSTDEKKEDVTRKEKQEGSTSALNISMTIGSQMQIGATDSKDEIGPVNSPSIQELTSSFADVVIVQTEQPVLLTDEEAAVAPIKAAAQEIRVAAAKWSSINNPIISVAEALSVHLTELSDYHNGLKTQGTAVAKRGFIKAAQDILTQTNALLVPANLLAEKCTDMRLKKQLLLTLEQMTTIAQQLKIVAAVKASAPMDRDRDQQLIGCARNLMHLVKTCLRECESSSLRQENSTHTSKMNLNGSNPSLAKPVIKFRRAIYRVAMTKPTILS